MGKKREKTGAPTPNLKICQGATLREENTGIKRVDVSSILKMQHLQRLAKWASGEARIPPLGAFFGERLAASAEASGILLDPSVFLCQRCETILQPGFNCTTRIEKNLSKARKHKKSSFVCQNNVIYACHFCSHQNLKRGTAEGHVKHLLASRPKCHSDSHSQCFVGKMTSKSEEALAMEKEPPQEAARVIPLKPEPMSDLKSRPPRKEVAAREIPASSPSTPLQKLVNISERKRKVIGSTLHKPAGSANSASGTEGTEGTSHSNKRRRKAWSSLKEIVEDNDLEKNRNISNFAIPFII